jgi:alkylation response protein AidB-like acyl-CoA dehydrogenase
MHDSLYFSEQHLAVREMVRSFARDEVAPVAAEFDESQEFPWDNVKKMADLGLLGIPWSEELGGAGLDTISFMIAIEELARVCASHSIVVSAHTTLGTSPIVNFGNDAQRKKYVPLLASGSVLGGFGLTEPGAGSDAGGTRTTAVKKGNHYLLNGSKRFITHAGVGEIFIVTAVTDPLKDQLLRADQGDLRSRAGEGSWDGAQHRTHADEGLSVGKEGEQAGLARE